MIATEQYFPVVLFIMLNKVILTGYLLITTLAAQDLTTLTTVVLSSDLGELLGTKWTGVRHIICYPPST